MRDSGTEEGGKFEERGWREWALGLNRISSTEDLSFARCVVLWFGWVLFQYTPLSSLELYEIEVWRFLKAGN